MQIIWVLLLQKLGDHQTLSIFKHVRFYVTFPFNENKQWSWYVLNIVNVP